MFGIHSNQHIFIAGKTQSGKSELLKSFINQFYRVVFHDRKHEHQAFAKQNHYYVINTPEQLQTLLHKGAKRIVYQPADPSVEDFDEVCHLIYDLGNTTFVIDECASYAPTGRVPFWCGELMRLGSGRGIGVISLTQRPRDVSNVLISESTLIISFRLALATDRTKMAETCGGSVNPKLPEDPTARSATKSLATLEKYHFMAFNGDTDEVQWCSPIPIRKTNQNL